METRVCGGPVGIVVAKTTVLDFGYRVPHQDLNMILANIPKP